MGTKNEIITGDCIDVLETLEAIYRLCVSSPPYPLQKDCKLSVEEWIVWMGLVARGIYRALLPAGILCLNCKIKRRQDGSFDSRLFTAVPEILETAGFTMIDVYIWVKPNPAPNGDLSRVDLDGWEPIFVATKAADFDFYMDPQFKPYSAKSISAAGTLVSGGKYSGGSPGEPNPKGARMSNILTISSSGDQNRPRAKGGSYPLGLPERFIRQYTKPGDYILDPFAGVGTTLKAGQPLGCNGTGIERDPAEAERAREWLGKYYQKPLIGR